MINDSSFGSQYGYSNGTLETLFLSNVTWLYIRAFIFEAQRSSWLQDH